MPRNHTGERPQGRVTDPRYTITVIVTEEA